MFKTILAFIKAHTIATAITTTVVVSTVVTTPIIINKVQEPKQEIQTGQVQENITDNTIADNTIENEITEENVVNENTTIPEEQKPETPTEENKQEQSKTQETTKPTTNKTEKPSTPTNNKTEKPVETKPNRLEPKYVSFGDIMYDEANKEVHSSGVYTKEQWLSSGYQAKKSQLQNSKKSAREADTKSKSNKEYIREKIQWNKGKIEGCKEAYYWYIAHKDEVQLTDQYTFLYKGLYYEGREDVLYGQFTITYPNEIKILERDYLPYYPEVGPQEEAVQNQLAELEKAYNYIKSH